MRNVVDERPADAAAVAGLDETLLRTGIERVLAVDEFGVQHRVALLVAALQVRQAFPVHEVFRTGYAGRSHGRREIARTGCGVLALDAENTVDPAVFVSRQTHVVNIGRRFAVLGHRHGVVPETEVVDAVRRFGHGEKRFAVGALHSCHDQVAAVELDGAGVHHGIDADPFHAVGIAPRVEVIAPEERCVSGCQDRITVAGIDAVIGRIGYIGTGNEGFVAGFQLGYAFLKRFHVDLVAFSVSL